MKRIRVMVVDDSVVVRRLVSDSLKRDPVIEIAGVAPNGRIALQKIPQVNPDVITLNVEMPVIDGLETLKHVRASYPNLPVIMFSTLTERGAGATLDALTLGASDYVTKPSNVGKVRNAFEQIEKELIPKIKSLCGAVRLPEPGLTTPVARSRTIRAVPPRKPVRTFAKRSASASGTIKIVAIGCSTGGPNALAEVIPALPADFPVPIVIVQHMPTLFTKLLAERLDAKSQLTVVEGGPGVRVRSGTVYIAPGDYHMTVKRLGRDMVLATNQDPRENSCRPAVDVLFRSVAHTFDSSVLGVVLTGMGQDGLLGSEDILEAGGRVIVQDQASSVVWGMPGLIAKANLADNVLPLDQLSREIKARAGQGHPGSYDRWLARA